MAGIVRGSIFRRNVTWQIVGSGTQALFSGLVLFFLGRQLQATGFGQFSIITGYVVVANLLVEPRMQDVAARQFWDFSREDVDRSRHRQFFMDFVVFEVLVKLIPMLAVVLLAAPLAALGNLPPGSAWLIALCAVGTYLTKIGYGLTTGVLRVLGRSDQFTYCGSGEVLLRLLLMVALSQTQGLTVGNSIVALVISGTITNAVQLAIAARHFGGLWHLVRGWQRKASITRLLTQRSLLVSNMGLSAADLMNKDLDVTLMSPLLPAAEIGVYKMAKNIALLAWRAVDPFYLALMPELSRRVQMGDNTGTQSLLKRSSVGLAVIALGLSACAWTGLYLFGNALLGPAFAETPHIMAWMLIGVVVAAPLVWGHPLAVALNRAGIALAGSLLSMFVGICAFMVLVRLYGAHGAAIAWAMTLLAFFFFTTSMSYRAFRKLAGAQ